MEAPPSPDSVGREFVRQYYTLLNRAPEHLHRFYNNQSSFVHGGLDPPNRETSPMIGQKQIHHKIQQLNFQDCHAKIAQVDSQSTLGNGVVVQVTGELSNAGQPMRRFTQTFVLAAQSPKKYYVHNDIFRYQDEIISDEECENENRSDTEEELSQERPAQSIEMTQINQQPIPYPYSPNNAPLPGNIAPVPQHHHAQPAPHVMQPPQPMPTVNGVVHPDEMTVMAPNMPPQHVPAGQSPPMNAAPMSVMQPAPMIPGQVPAPVPAAPIEEIPQPIEEGAGDNADNYVESQAVEMEQVDIITEPTSNEPKTYANLLKTGSSVGYAAATQINVTPTTQPPKSISPPSVNRFENREMQQGVVNNMNQPRNNRGDNNRNPRPGQPQQRVPRPDARGPPIRNNMNEDGNNFEERRRSQGNFSDSNQLFLGNLPHNATEDDLREIFSNFGNILDLRIHSKPNSKAGPPGSRAPPNYGFITYETQNNVQNCLAAKPIYFSTSDKNSVILNVEEKKVKDRTPYGGGRVGGGMDNNMGPRPRDNNGPRPRVGGMPGGPPRGGGAAGGGPMGGGGGGASAGGGNRPNNRGAPNRGPNNTYTTRR